MIDGHQHFWKLARGDYPWPTENEPLLYRDYAPEELLPLLQANGVEGTVAVQAAPSMKETEYLLRLADEHQWILGVVGWLDLTSDQFYEHLKAFLKYPKFKGLRPMLQDLHDEWLFQPNVLENLELTVNEGVPLDFLIVHRQLPIVKKCMERFPQMKAVIDHFGKPDIAQQQLHPWMEDIEALASYPHLYIKMSGLVTEAKGDWTEDDFSPYVRHVVNTFGPDRMLFGSDWPVCKLAASYEEVLQLVKNQLLAHHLTQAQWASIFKDNAREFYQL
ncbi:amidohydrolase family protein [Bacillaceae bacterium SIJ1]|uniref:amidohydrolase family protein n=1 Tax=Litoribacterium kuwaitense TaxID=1398745 RepID=UPI0013EB8EC6|nr:amidohydrolase family protein [Litoribacterium kuwaitense]NGP45446.1 amidohydrolase family protein [Litoribacterium kuwaitense]